MLSYRNVIIGLGAAAVFLTSQVSWAAPCGNITYTGCCSGTTAKYCKSGQLVTKDCTKDKYGPACGWVTKFSAYSCNKTATSDPKGKNVRDCSKLPPKPDGGVTKKDYGTTKKDAGSSIPCGKITSAGCCDGSNVKYCSSGKLKTKSCVGSKYGSLCGWVAALKGYGCSKTATADPSGKLPLKCGGTSTTPDGGGTTKPCGMVTSKGCCNGEKVNVCKGGVLKIHDCTTNPTNKKCGWDTSKKYYTCTSSGLSDPNGTYKKACNPTKKDSGVVLKKDKGGSAKKDTGAINPTPTPKDEDSCSVASGNSPSGLALSLILLALALRRRRR